MGCKDTASIITKIGLSVARKGKAALKAFEFANMLRPMISLSSVAIAAISLAPTYNFCRSTLLDLHSIASSLPGAGKSWSPVALTTLDVVAVALRDTLAMALDVVAVCTEEFA